MGYHGVVSGYSKSTGIPRVDRLSNPRVLGCHKGDCFEEIVAEPLATIKGHSKFLSPLQNLEEIILDLNGYKENVMSKMDDWSN